MVINVLPCSDLYTRNLLDGYLSRALNVELENGRLTPIDDSAYVLTLDYTIKMLNIHERSVVCKMLTELAVQCCIVHLHPAHSSPPHPSPPPLPPPSLPALLQQVPVWCAGDH